VAYSTRNKNSYYNVRALDVKEKERLHASFYLDSAFYSGKYISLLEIYITSVNLLGPNKTARLVTLLIYIWEVPESNIDRDIGYSG
jgi:hypothetical protein